MASFLGEAFAHNPEAAEYSGRPRRQPLPKRSPLGLAGVIEAEIIPRMLIVHRSGDDGTRAALPCTGISAEQAASFTDLVIAHEAYTLIQHVESFLARGVTIETILIELLAPAARRLGEYWEEDRCDFVDVTMGLWRLQEIIHEMAARLPGLAVRPSGERRALFAVAPGEQHSFGVVMVEEFFRRAGWQTWSAPDGSQAELVEIAGKQWLDMIGLSVSTEAHIESLRALIDNLRRKSRNPGVCIMVGGYLLESRPRLAQECGADVSAPDARQAVARAEILVEMRTHHVTSRC